MTDRRTAGAHGRALALLQERTRRGTATPPERVAYAVLTQSDNGAEERHGPMKLNPPAADELREMIVSVMGLAIGVLERADQFDA